MGINKKYYYLQNLDIPSILGIYIYEGSLNESIQVIIHDAMGCSYKNLCISATGAHGIVYAKRHHEFAGVLHSFYRNLPDGIPAVWDGKLKGKNRMERCYGPDFFKETIIASREKNIGHLFFVVIKKG